MSFFGSQASKPFGSTSTPSLFGSSTQNTQPQNNTGSSLFGGNNTTNSQQNQSSNAFGQTQLAQPSGSNFADTMQRLQQQQQQPPQPQQHSLGTSQPQPPPLTNTVWKADQAQSIHQKPIGAQIQSLYEQWKPDSPTCAFKTYLYNSVGQGSAVFHRPEAGDDEQRWEAALAKRPDENSIPVVVRGFESLGRRVETQINYVKSLQARIHEIHDSCTAMTAQYHIEVSIRAAEAKRRHITLSQRCLRLASKVQLLRNHGYTMDAAEEDLKKRLTALEKRAFDPLLSGRHEEIWARLINVRERARLLQGDLEKKKRNGQASQVGETIDEEVIAKVKKILTDYDSQIVHLSKEVKDIGNEFQNWLGEDDKKS